MKNQELPSRTSTVQSVERALRVLLSFTEKRTEVGVTEISRELACHKSTVSRLMATLEDMGFLRTNPATGKLQLGYQVIQLGSLALESVNLRTVSLPYMDRLATTCGESVHIGIPVQHNVMLLEQVETKSHTLRAAVETGSQARPHCTAIGKAYLAFLPREEMLEIVDAIELQRFTPNTITNKDLLIKEIERIHTMGYSVDNEEHHHGIRCVAAPVFDHSGQIHAAISVFGPSLRMTHDKIENLAPMVIEAGMAISTELGFHGDSARAATSS